MALNDYHRKFLRLLLRSKVRFLIIGGMARHIQTDAATRDLDILVDISPTNLLATEHVLCTWKNEHPLHDETVPPHPPLNLRPNVQIKFPAFEGCTYQKPDGEPASIHPLDGIDVLTSLKGTQFDELFSRSVSSFFEGQEVRMLSPEDIDRTQAMKPA